MLRRLRDVNLALLLLRVGMGGMMLTHGIPKLMRGPDLWPKLGKAVEHVGISEGHAVFGAAAVLAETVGAVLVILGFKTRPAAFSVFLTMVVAAAMGKATAGARSAILSRSASPSSPSRSPGLASTVSTRTERPSRTTDPGSCVPPWPRETSDKSE